MNILLTGGAGYIGCSLVNYLDEYDLIDQIIVYDNLSKISPNFFLGDKKLNKVTFVKGDILNSYKLEQCLDGIDVCIHLAAITSFPVNHVDNLKYEQINKWGTLNLLRSLVKCNTLKKLIFLSSSTVYGNREFIKGAYDPQPEHAYGSSKYEAEKYIESLLDKSLYSIIRPGNIFGYNLCFRMDTVINKFIFESIVHKKITIFGDGEQKRPFVELNFLCGFIRDVIVGKRTINNICPIANFNASLNELKEILTSTVVGLEHIYLNQNLEFDSYSYSDELLQKIDKVELLNQSIKEFKEAVRVMA